MPKSYKSLGSVDAPNVVRDLDPVFKPRSACYTTEETFYAASLPGFERLPRQLVPDRQRALQPPVYLYGWEIDREKLLQYAEDNSISQYVQEERWSREDEDDDDDDDDADFEPEIAVVLDRSLTYLKVLCTLVTDVGLELRLKFPLQSVLAHGTMVPFFSLYSNYQLADAPSKDEIATLRAHLRNRIGEKEPPKWLPDEDEFRWRQRSWR